MNANIKSGGRPLTAVVHQMSSEGLIRSYVDKDGHLRWAITDLGRTFQTLIAEQVGEAPVASRYNVGEGAIVREVVTPDQSGKLVVDIGPAVRIYLNDKKVPDHIEIGLLNRVVGELEVMEEVTPAHPQRIGLDIGMARTRPRSKITKVEFELVGASVEFAGMFDRQGRLRCYSPLVQWGDGGCRAPGWTYVPLVKQQGEDS